MEVEVRIPEFVEVLREVTEEASYDSYLLASELQKKGRYHHPTRRVPRGQGEKEVAEVLATLERQASAKKFARKLMSSVRNGGETAAAPGIRPCHPCRTINPQEHSTRRARRAAARDPTDGKTQHKYKRRYFVQNF